MEDLQDLTSKIDFVVQYVAKKFGVPVEQIMTTLRKEHAYIIFERLFTELVFGIIHK